MNPSKQFWKAFNTSSGYKLQIEERDRKQVGISVYHPMHRGGMNIPAADAPAVALAILEAAGWPEEDANSALTIMQDLRCVIEFDERKAQEAAALEKLTKRRGELAVEYFEGAYDHLPRAAYQRAIDRIIELEDKAQS